MLKYFKESFRRKKARRVTARYSTLVKEFELEKDGVIEFAVWQNPLYTYVSEISQSNVDFFRKYVKEGDLVIDIGANVGDTTIPLAIASGKEGTTLAFDPNPYVYEVLRQNSKLNQDKTNIVPVNSAISAKAGEFYFASTEASFANGGISDSPKSNNGKFVYPAKINGVNLSEFLQENYPNYREKFSFVKIDTEGYDKEIIKSIADLLAECKPVIVAEVFAGNTDEEKMELFDVIAQHGYEIYQFDSFEENTTTKKLEVASDILSWKTTTDIYAIPK